MICSFCGRELLIERHGHIIYFQCPSDTCGHKGHFDSNNLLSFTEDDVFNSPPTVGDYFSSLLF